MALTEGQRERYSRHLMLKEIGDAGQEKLLESKVLVIGAGGLGSPAIMYLAAGGVGTIGIADGDEVDLSNMQRQIIHRNEAIGSSKVESAAMRVREINPDVKINLYPERIQEENIGRIIESYDFILDCVDNFAAKFLINDACVSAGKPFCHAGIQGFYGEVLTYVPGEGPCYRCIFEEVPEDEDTGHYPTGSVIGSVPGIVGSIQALEAQKYLTGAGELLTGRILTFDGLAMKFRTVDVPEASPLCSACGKGTKCSQMGEEGKHGK